MSLRFITVLDLGMHERLQFYVQAVPFNFLLAPDFQINSSRKVHDKCTYPLVVSGCFFPCSCLPYAFVASYHTWLVALRLMKTSLQMKRILSPLSATCLLLLLPTSYATCYFPNGKTDSNYRQCPGSLSCCAAGEACLSNGYCFTANFGILYRGLCADKTWPLSDCPRACYEGSNSSTDLHSWQNPSLTYFISLEIPDGWANISNAMPRRRC